MHAVIAINNVRLKANGNHDEHLLDLSVVHARGEFTPKFPTGKPIGRAESGLIAIRLSILNALISRKDVDERKKRLPSVVRRACGCVNRG